jgi:quercetin dioxygenase-like cupin family protein
MAFETRRIVTANGADGASRLRFDSMIRSQPGKLQAGVSIVNLWINETMPPVLDGPDPAAAPFPLLPQNNGAIFRILELAPGAEPLMHATATIDYIIVLAGELTMLLEDGSEVRLAPHEVMVQRATAHGWANRGKVPCRFATVVIDASDKA